MSPEQNNDKPERIIRHIPDSEEETHISHDLLSFLDQMAGVEQAISGEVVSKEEKAARLAYLLEQSSEGNPIDDKELHTLRRELQKGSHTPYEQ